MANALGTQNAFFKSNSSALHLRNIQEQKKAADKERKKKELKDRDDGIKKNRFVVMKKILIDKKGF